MLDGQSVLPFRELSRVNLGTKDASLQGRNRHKVHPYIQGIDWNVTPRICDFGSPEDIVENCGSLFPPLSIFLPV